MIHPLWFFPSRRGWLRGRTDNGTAGGMPKNLERIWGCLCCWGKNHHQIKLAVFTSPQIEGKRPNVYINHV